jgi:hypothetical protein
LRCHADSNKTAGLSSSPPVHIHNFAASWKSSRKVHVKSKSSQHNCTCEFFAEVAAIPKYIISR